MKRYLFSLLVALALIATGFAQTVTTCPTGQYLDSENSQCVNKTSVSANIQSTPQDFNFVVLFDKTAPYTDSTALSEATAVTLQDSTANVTTNPAFSIGFLDDEKSLARLIINAPEFTRYTVISVKFADLQDDDTTPFYVVSPTPFTTLPSSQLSQSDEDKINALTKLDRGLEYAWIAVTSLNPYAFLYMNTKLYRETLEMFKRINVPYGSFAGKFLRENNNKVSGYKGPNIFPITVEGNSVSSGWNRGRENGIPYGDLDRVQDLKAPTTEPVHNYDAFPLFLDNYGIQITVFFGIIALIIACEIVNLLFCCNRRRQNNTAKSVRLFQGTRNFLRWNMLIGSIIGSFQSLTFYFMAQMKTYDLQDTHNSHDKLNFWFAIGSIILLGALFPLWLLYRIIAVPRNHKIGDDQQEVPSAYLRYGMFLVIYNQMRRFVFTFPFALMLRAAVLAALTLFLPNHPVASTAAILAVTCVFVIYLVVLRPFKRTFYFIYQLINELVLVFYLGTLLFLANKGDDKIISDHDSDITGYIFIALWLFVPFLGIVFGLFDLLARMIRHYTQKKSPYLVPVPIEAAAGQQMVEGSAEKPVDLKIPSAMLTPKDKIVEGTPLSNGGGAQVQTTDPMLLSQIINQITQEETYDLAGVKEEEPPKVVSKPSVTIITPTVTEEEKIYAKPRRTPPSLSYIENVQPIVEEVDKEQASADLKQQVSSRIRKQPGWTTMSQARSSSVSSPEPKDNMRRSHHVSFRDSQNVSRYEGSDAGGPRTQDRVKAMPVNLDIPSGRNSARSGYTRGLGYSLNMENVYPRLSANSRNSVVRDMNYLPPPPTMTMSQGRRTPRKIFE